MAKQTRPVAFKTYTAKEKAVIERFLNDCEQVCHNTLNRYKGMKKRDMPGFVRQTVDHWEKCLSAYKYAQHLNHPRKKEKPDAHKRIHEQSENDTAGT